MKISIQAAILKDALKAVSGLVDEVKLTIKTDGLSIIAMDKSNIAMVTLELPKASAIEWETEATEEVDEILNMELAGLMTVLKRADKTDIITLVSDGARLNVSLTGNRKYKVPLLDLAEDKTQKVPQLTHKYSVTIDSAKLVSALEDASITASDGVQFLGTKTSFVLKSEGDAKLSIAEVTLTGGDVKIETEEEKTACKFSTEYLNKMVLKLGTSVKLKLGEDYPLKLEYKTEKFEVAFILAPRVSNE